MTKLVILFVVILAIKVFVGGIPIYKDVEKPIHLQERELRIFVVDSLVFSLWNIIHFNDPSHVTRVLAQISHEQVFKVLGSRVKLVFAEHTKLYVVQVFY